MKGASGRCGSQNEGRCAKSETGKAGVLAKEPTQNNLTKLSFSSIVAGWTRQQDFEIGCWR